jgi:hypothetical protein
VSLKARGSPEPQAPGPCADPRLRARARSATGSPAGRLTEAGTLSLSESVEWKPDLVAISAFWITSESSPSSSSNN